MSMGFSVIPPNEVEVGTFAPDSRAATLALDSGAISPTRVIAYYAARHLLVAVADQRDSAPGDVLTLAAWLVGGDDHGDDDPEADETEEEDETEEAEEAEEFERVTLVDGWPQVLLSAVAPAGLALVVMAFVAFGWSALT